jgi:hypothetical protein
MSFNGRVAAAHLLNIVIKFKFINIKDLLIILDMYQFPLSVVIFTLESYLFEERFKSGVQTGTNEYLGILKWFTLNSQFFIVDLVPCRI